MKNESEKAHKKKIAPRMISNDTDNFVEYTKYNGAYAVMKGLFTGNDDTAEMYKREIEYQTMLSEYGYAPRLLQTGMKRIIKGREFITWISEDAGLPIQERDVLQANVLLKSLYDMGIELTWSLHQNLFVKGFDGKVRVTDFKHAEKTLSPSRTYIQWAAQQKV